MFQQRNGVRLIVPGVMLLCLLAAVYLFAARRASKPEPGIERHTMEGSPEETLKYWTKEKMRKARPAPMPHVDEGKQGEQGKKPSRRGRSAQQKAD